MSTPLLPPPITGLVPDPFKKKRVLLIDTSHAKREMRADVMRRLGIEVDSAADIPEARAWWRPALYDLVLINLEEGRGQRDIFCDDLRGATPPQRLAFLVGQPEYLADAPNTNEEAVAGDGDGQAAGTVKVVIPAEPAGASQRWGILEASRRISAVRSAYMARTKAMRALPPPPRDSDGQREKSTATRTSLDSLLKEELQ